MAIRILAECAKGNCGKCPGETRRDSCTHGCHAGTMDEEEKLMPIILGSCARRECENCPGHIRGEKCVHACHARQATDDTEAEAPEEPCEAEGEPETSMLRGATQASEDPPPVVATVGALPPMEVTQASGVVATVGALPPMEVTQASGDPSLVRDEVLGFIRKDIRAQPRSQQTEIGASEIGTPCTRKLVGQLANLPEINPTTSWPAYVGTQLHEAMERILHADNEVWLDTGDGPRWLIETEVECGKIGDTPLIGHSDCYDRLTLGVIDWKFPSLTRVRGMKSRGVGQTYQVQAHLYGYGFSNLGYQVDWVGILAIPTSGILEQSYFYSEPYDESVALRALEKATALRKMIDNVGPEATARMATLAEDYCEHCPFFSAVPRDGTFTCQGAEGMQDRTHRPPTRAFGR